MSSPQHVDVTELADEGRVLFLLLNPMEGGC